MEINYMIVIPVVLLVLLLIVWLIWRNNKDEKKFKKELIEADTKPKKHDSDNI
jgi:hypothetical protein